MSESLVKGKVSTKANWMSSFELKKKSNNYDFYVIS